MKPEFLPFVASKITQARPRRLLKFCVLFSLISFCLTMICVGSMGIFICPVWWLCLLSSVASLLPLVFSFAAAQRGCAPCVLGACIASLCNVCTAIAVLCVIMTNISMSVRAYEKCVLEKPLHINLSGGDSSDYSYLDVNCSSYSAEELDYFGYLRANRAVVTGLVTVYAAACVVLNGLGMVYMFFLSRKCRNQPSNWLTATTHFSSSKRVSSRSTSGGSV